MQVAAWSWFWPRLGWEMFASPWFPPVAERLSSPRTEGTFRASNGRAMNSMACGAGDAWRQPIHFKVKCLSHQYERAMAVRPAASSAREGLKRASRNTLAIQACRGHGSADSRRWWRASRAVSGRNAEQVRRKARGKRRWQRHTANLGACVAFENQDAVRAVLASTRCVLIEKLLAEGGVVLLALEAWIGRVGHAAWTTVTGKGLLMCSGGAGQSGTRTAPRIRARGTTSPRFLDQLSTGRRNGAAHHARA